ncbi:DUF3662 and FHA domain-containing protein [Corynebacterium macclintockiae]|uniref:DUF3662 and FHA domain-containing protein n=1 Tax=Corynebacterium macclintockiae TaxID=2913501 RepID=UPI0025515895|nr:DUF3662 and FHA domain-containing protein [Corynebacterium macclintockiae]MDK8891195.1 DUF3662 and FHA domain-containing protein [Corynebacterium macclintockiae]
MSLFGRIKKLDNSLQRGLDNGFARVFGGEVVPTEIDEVLKQYAEESVMTDAQGQRLAPSYFQVLVSTRDYASLTESRPRLAEEMGDRLSRFIRNQGWRTNEPVKVNLSAHDGLHSGQMRADARFDVPRATNSGNSGNSGSANTSASANAHNASASNDYMNNAAPQHSPDGGYGEPYPRAADDADHPAWPSSQSGERSLVSQDYDAHSHNSNPINRTDDSGADKSLGDLVSPAEAPNQEGSAGNEFSGAAGATGATGAAGAAGLGGAAAVHHASPDFARKQSENQPQQSNQPAQPQEQSPAQPQEQVADNFEHPASYPGTEVIAQTTPSPIRGGEGAGEGEGELKVTLTLHDGSDRTYELRKGSNIIGRGNGVDLRIPDTGVSRQHADITWDGFDAILTDLQSTNGTSVNGTPIENWLLANGDVISMGHSEIGVEFH